MLMYSDEKQGLSQDAGVDYLSDFCYQPLFPHQDHWGVLGCPGRAEHTLAYGQPNAYAFT